MPQLLRPKEGVLNRERSVEDEEYHRLLIQKGAANAKAPTAQIDDEEVDQLEPLFTLTLALNPASSPKPHPK